MFRQHPAHFLPPFRPLILLAATAGGLALALGTALGVGWLLSAMGWLPVPPPVEVSYTPYGDGRTLEQIQAGAPANPLPEEAGVPQDR